MRLSSGDKVNAFVSCVVCGHTHFVNGFEFKSHMYADVFLLLCNVVVMFMCSVRFYIIMIYSIYVLLVILKKKLFLFYEVLFVRKKRENKNLVKQVMIAIDF